MGLEALVHPEQLPAPEDIDHIHKQWRSRAIEAAEAKDIVGFSHGVAAKLINVYLKGAFVCGANPSHSHVAALHPPIDSLLLNELSQKNVGGLKNNWDKARKIRWSKFESSDYEELIASIRKALEGKPMWKIELYWPGHR